MAKRPALGKGIGALLTSASQDGRHKYFVCPVEELKPHHQQPRKTFNDAKMAELVASIREKGVIQPLVVRHTDDHYQIIAGERRWRAAQKAGLKEVPVVIQDVSEDWALEMALIENIQREDLNPIEEAEAYRHLMSNFDLSQEEVARRVGRERPTVANALRLLRLPREIQQDVIDGQLSMGHARALLSLDGAARIKEARDQVVRKQFSVRQTEALVKKLKGSTGQPAARKTRIDPELADLAARLQRCLGTKVNILPQTRGGKGGKIEISYYSAEEFERLLELFERR
ncbi:MAG: ParB/RepB/Spo0J family partition protein [Deltaproteobacteria bacterium]|jgi:ParB family chromosome partitioning protein|nr:ParB/RepB/Spo0J family partition protein [Deltaproteobacteria bacterium]MBW2512312.1 ParB/RepB/Spo0J family partition protein [Deltaproteobacteria bacterium]MDH4007417.1 ParB/RepB/Spo0J family partition protein [Desulfuromonadales bacterium]